MKHLIKAAFAALALMSTPVHASLSADDGFRFVKEDWERTDMRIRVVVHPSLADLRSAAIAAGASMDNGTPRAWSKVYTNANSVCEIHIIDPKKDGFRKYVGHELLHCMYGRWHD